MPFYVIGVIQISKERIPVWWVLLVVSIENTISRRSDS